MVTVPSTVLTQPEKQMTGVELANDICMIFTAVTPWCPIAWFENRRLEGSVLVGELLWARAVLAGERSTKCMKSNLFLEASFEILNDDLDSTQRDLIGLQHPKTTTYSD